ncbi:MAG: VWA domain-containing protein [Clostridium sp.]|nr:VWA domain-containing protein [Clostridium sp.]
MEQTEIKDTKTQVYNVVILDKSGSMECIRQAAIDGFNETLNGIKKAQEKFADTQEHYVTLVAFCECEKKLIYDKVLVAEAKKLTLDDYEPCCGTPLYDAIGFTLNSMRKHIKGIENAVVVVTIITDGMENASTEYNGKTIKNLVE